MFCMLGGLAVWKSTRSGAHVTWVMLLYPKLVGPGCFIPRSKLGRLKGSTVHTGALEDKAGNLKMKTVWWPFDLDRLWFWKIEGFGFESLCFKERNGWGPDWEPLLWQVRLVTCGRCLFREASGFLALQNLVDLQRHQRTWWQVV